MLAAGKAAESGASVILLEKMEEPGKKLRLTGNLRCNFTNKKDIDDFILMYGDNGQFLRNVFSIFFREDLIALLSRYGIGIKIEPDGRIFPSTDKAIDVYKVLLNYMSENHVELKTGVRALGIIVEKGKVAGIKAGEKVFPGQVIILASGGMSYPETGSSGDGYRIAETSGHTIVKLRPSLVPLVVVESELVKKLQGISLKDIRLTSFKCSSDQTQIPNQISRDSGRGISGKSKNTNVIESRRGDILFTHFGISGPVTLKMSLAIVDALEYGPVTVLLDFLPDLDIEMLRTRLQNGLNQDGKKQISNFMNQWLPDRIIDVLLTTSDIDYRKLNNQITASERERIISSLKSFRLKIKSALPIDQAMVTAGGVSLREVNPRTMGSRLVKGLYFCGEVLDIDAETGGYNLQAAFSTGYVAGKSAADYALHQQH
jgi:predicted flavoprotein YhiN